MSTPVQRTVASRLLEVLAERGVRYLFGNVGTDWAPVIEALSSAQAGGAAIPEPLPLAHEGVAVGMAHGYFLATGVPQAVGVHVNVGLANAAMGALNAARSNVPLLLLAGLTPVTEGGRLGSRTTPIHWGQDMFDQTSLVREAVKWHRDLHVGAQVDDVIDRALSIASCAPAGPVYVGLPREVLAEPYEVDPGRGPRRQASSAGPHPAPSDVARLVDRIASARNPVVITSREDHAAWRPLDELARRFALPVVSFWSSGLVIRTDHPFSAGGDPTRLLAEADLVIVLDSLVPWLPHKHRVSDDCDVVTIAPDPLYTDVPMRSFRSDLVIPALVGPTLEALLEELDARGLAESDTVAERRDRVEPALDAARRQMRVQVNEVVEGPLSPAYVSQRITAVLDDPTIVNELGSVPTAMELTRPGSYHGVSPAGGLGWGLPAALGIKLAEPSRCVVATVGDGSYLFANPAACHQAAMELGLPVVTIVFDNGGWGAVRRSTLEMYPDGEAAAAGLDMPLSHLGPAPDRVKLIEAFGGHGEVVTEADQFDDALIRAQDAAMREGRQALLTVRVRPRA